MEYSHIIGFTGRAQSGKTTAANILATHGWLRVSFADPLRKMLSQLCNIQDKTASPRELCSHSVRHALQTLGTDWGRKMIGEDIWVEAMRTRLGGLMDEVEDGVIRGVVIDDVRFDNEADLINELGGIIVCLHRSSALHMDHESEKGVNLTLINHHITNDSDVQDLHIALAERGISPHPPHLELPTSAVYSAP